MRLASGFVRIAPLLLLAAPGLRASDSSGHGYDFRTIARTGQTEDGVTFGSYFQPGSINNHGSVSFAPALQAGGESVFLAYRGELKKVRGAGQALPGGAQFGYTLGPVPMNAYRDTGFISVGLDYALPIGLGAGMYRTVFGITIPVMLPGITRAPDGTHFQGAAFNAHMNDRYETVFPGLTCSTAPSSVPAPGSPPLPNPCAAGKLAFGVYRSNVWGQISVVVKPGTPAPGGSTFDYAQVPFINNSGDVAFDGHVFGEPCNDPQGQLAYRIFCGESVYLKNGRNGTIISIAHQGQAAPVPGKAYYAAFGPVVNERGQVAFIADLSADGSGQNAVFLYSGGVTQAVAQPGDAMPGGGVFASAGGFPHNAYLNDRQQVAFVGTLADGGQGLYVWKDGTVRLVARTGTNVDSGATIASLDDFGAGAASSQIAINDLGQIVFAAKLSGGDGALLVATPR